MDGQHRTRSRPLDRCHARSYNYINCRRKSLKDALTMKHFVRLVLALVLCPVLGLSGVLVGIPAVRTADMRGWAAAIKTITITYQP